MKLPDKEVDRYSLGYQEMIELMGEQDVFRSVCRSFDYGFIKGIRYQKAKEKRMRKQELIT